MNRPETNHGGPLGPCRCVLFDLYHTLTSVEAAGATPGVTAAALGVSADAWREQLLHHSHDRLAGAERDPYRIVAVMARTLNPGIPDRVVREVVAGRCERFRRALAHPPETTVRTLRALKARGLRLGLVSNADVMEAAGWSESPLSRRFDSVVFSCEVGLVKPDPRIFRRCCEDLGTAPKECAFVGDGGSNELVAARELGMRTILTLEHIRSLWPERIPELRAQADVVIEALPDLLEPLPGGAGQ